MGSDDLETRNLGSDDPGTDAPADDLVRAVATQVRHRYVLAEEGARAAAVVEARLADGAYAGLDLKALCATLTEDLRQVCPDRHLRVIFHETPRGRWDGDGWGPDRLAEHWAQARLFNHGVQRVERLAGNVGYLDLRSIDEAEQSAPAITAAMGLLQHTYAMLLDLRDNDGGAPSGVAYLCSFFFPPQPPVHLNNVYRRESETTQQFWTYPHLPGPRYLDRPVYVLTGPRTFSGAEEIAYNLQQQGRATVVGETTRGGAHPVGHYWLAPQASIRVPVMRSVNPVSATNWEGVGVQPDVAVSAEKAFSEGYGRALRTVLERLAGELSPGESAVAREAAEALATTTPTTR